MTSPRVHQVVLSNGQRLLIEERPARTTNGCHQPDRLVLSVGYPEFEEGEPPVENYLCELSGDGILAVYGGCAVDLVKGLVPPTG